MPVKFVLVPGAWLGAWAWKKVIPLLTEKGHESYPVTLTGMGERVHLASKELGIETAIQDVVNIIEFNDLREFVLVGHSFAGKVVAPVADRLHDRVSGIIYLDAFRPDKVRSPQGAFDPSGEYGPPPQGTFAIPLTDKIIDRIGPDVQGEERSWMMSKATPWPVKPANEPITLSSKFDSIKNSFIFCSRSGDPVDDIIAGKWGKLDGPYRVIDSGHWPMITRPEELAEDLIALAGG